MSENDRPSKSLAGPLRGERTERIRELIAIAESDAPIEDSVLVRALELAGDEASPRTAGGADAVGEKEERRRLADVLARACSDASHLARVEAAIAEQPFGRRWICAFALARAGRHGAEISTVAVEALGEPDGDVRWAAAEILCHARSEAAARMLAAIASLAADDVRATHETVRCMRDDREPGVRRAAAAILGRLRGDVGAALAALGEAAGDESDPHFKRAVSGALERLKVG
jgi:HEAT repeat protein